MRKLGQYALEQKLEVYGLPVESADSIYNGEIVTVVALQGDFNKQLPLAYGVALRSGEVIAAIEKYLRPFPPKLPCGRGDTDKKTTWEEFDAATGLRSTTFRDGFNPNPDY